MDKRLIDADKQSDWLEKAAFVWFGRSGEYGEGYCKALSDIKTAMRSGEFAPDPIPLPTIKPGDKVRHKNHKEWGIGEVKECYQDGSGVRCFFPDLRLLERTKFLATVDLEVSHD